MEYEKIKCLTEIGFILIMIIITLVFHILFIIAIMAFCTISKKKSIRDTGKRKIIKED
jgi:competence protein ComGC